MPSTRRMPPSSTASGGSARLTARRTSATTSITRASAPTTRIHASHGIAIAPQAMSAVATSISGIGKVSAIPSNLFASSGGMKSVTMIDARQSARNSESSRKHAASASAVRVSHRRGVGARSSHGPRWVIPIRSKNTRPSMRAPTKDAMAYATVISRNHSGRKVTDAPIAFSWLAIESAASAKRKSSSPPKNRKPPITRQPAQRSELPRSAPAEERACAPRRSLPFSACVAA